MCGACCVVVSPQCHWVNSRTPSYENWIWFVSNHDSLSIRGSYVSLLLNCGRCFETFKIIIRGVFLICSLMCPDTVLFCRKGPFSCDKVAIEEYTQRVTVLELAIARESSMVIGAKWRHPTWPDLVRFSAWIRD